MINEYKRGYEDCYQEISTIINKAIVDNHDGTSEGMMRALVVIQSFLWNKLMELTDMEEEYDECSETQEKEVPQELKEIINLIVGGRR